MKFLSKIEDSFQIAGRGCVVVAATPKSRLAFGLHVHDSIQLRNPDGNVLNTHVAGIEILSGPNVKDRLAFQLPEDIVQLDFPAGTEIWLV